MRKGSGKVTMNKAIYKTVLLSGLILFPSQGLLAKIYNLDEHYTIKPHHFNYGKSLSSIGSSAQVAIASGDTVQGTIIFKGGHVQSRDYQDFLAYGFSTLRPDAEEIVHQEMFFLDAAGNTFGQRKVLPQDPKYVGGYSNRSYLGVYDPNATAPIDVYGIRYRITYGKISSYDYYNSYHPTFYFRPVVYNARYVSGDLFTSAVPEPSSWAMMGLGFAGLGVALRGGRRRRRRAGEAAAA